MIANFNNDYETHTYERSGQKYYTTLIDIVPQHNDRYKEQQRVYDMLPEPHVKTAKATVKLAPEDRQHGEFPTWLIRTNSRKYIEKVCDWYYSGAEC